jgi:predicted Zn-dependent protease
MAGCLKSAGHVCFQQQPFRVEVNVTRLFKNEEHRSEVVQHMVGAALMAAHYGRAKDADRIMDVLCGISPDNQSVFVSRGLVFIYSDRLNEAVGYLKTTVLSKWPGNEDARTALGLALKLLGMKTEAEAVLSGLLHGASEERVRDHARAILDMKVN